MRAAVTNYITAGVESGQIPFIGTVFPSHPIIVTEDDYEMKMANGLLQYVTSSQGSNGVLIVVIPESGRTRQSLTGYAAVDDSIVHQVELEIYFANPQGDAIAVQADHDTLCDALTIAIRADPTLGTAGNPGAIFGAGTINKTPVSVHQGPPFTGEDGMTVFIPSVVRFEAWEWVSGGVGV